MQSPKARFLALKDVAQRHRDVVDSSPFAIAMDMALLQVVHNLPTTDDVAKAAANYWRLQGATMYMGTLAHLGDANTEKTKTVDSGSLDHRV